MMGLKLYEVENLARYMILRKGENCELIWRDIFGLCYGIRVNRHILRSYRLRELWDQASQDLTTDEIALYDCLSTLEGA